MLSCSQGADAEVEVVEQEDAPLEVMVGSIEPSVVSSGSKQRDLMTENRPGWGEAVTLQRTRQIWSLYHRRRHRRLGSLPLGGVATCFHRRARACQREERAPVGAKHSWRRLLSSQVLSCVVCEEGHKRMYALQCRQGLMRMVLILGSW
jgi:hypothetical protein